MPLLMSTKLTKGGQTTVPKDIRRALDIADGSRVYWLFDGTRAWISAEPTNPVEVTSEADVLARLEKAEGARIAGKVGDATSLSAGLRTKYGL